MVVEGAEALRCSELKECELQGANGTNGAAAVSKGTSPEGFLVRNTGV